MYARVGGAWQPITASLPTPQDRWYSAWGVVATGSFPASQTTLPASTLTQVTNVLPFTSVVGRKYRITLAARALTGGTATGFFGVWLRDGTANLNSQVLWAQPVSYNGLNYTWKFDGDGTTKSYNCAIQASGGASTFYSDNSYDSSFYIEDVGPVTGSSIIPSVPITAWTAPTFQNGWVNLAGWAVAAYRKVGDQVYLRGLVTHAAAITPIATSVAFTLPVGFRPPANEIFAANAAGSTGWGEGAGRINVRTDGGVEVVVATTTQGSTAYTSLSGIQFSVT